MRVSRDGRRWQFQMYENLNFNKIPVKKKRDKKQAGRQAGKER